MGQVFNLDDTEALAIAVEIRKTLVEDKKVASICVVNRDGRPLVQISMSLAESFTRIIALRKARQAAKTGKSTRQLRDSVEEGSATPQTYSIKPEVFIRQAGGIPIYNDDKNLLGGVGISGLSNKDEDETYATFGVRESFL